MAAPKMFDLSGEVAVVTGGNGGIGRGRGRTPREVLGQEMKGGARAWACEPVREPNRSGVRSSQTTRSGSS